MTAVKGIAIAVSIVTVLAGAVAPVAAGPGCPPQDPTCGGATCVINSPAGNTLKGHVAVAWVFNSSTGDYDADVVLALERAGGQAFFRVSLSRYTQAIDQVSQASLACDVISATGSAILRAFGFSQTQQLKITAESISDTDGFGPTCTTVNCTGGGDTHRKSSLANIRMYVIGK